MIAPFVEGKDSLEWAVDLIRKVRSGVITKADAMAESLQVEPTIVNAAVNKLTIDKEDHFVMIATRNKTEGVANFDNEVVGVRTDLIQQTQEVAACCH